MTTSRTRTRIGSIAVGLMATSAIALLPSLAAAPASAAGDKPSCSKEPAPGSSDKKCPSPTPSPTRTTPQGNETGCRDLIGGDGHFRGVNALPSAGGTIDFKSTYAAPTCSEVTYTVIARDMDTLAELGREAQSGNGVTQDLESVIPVAGYLKNCVAVDVVVSDGDVVDDIGPNSRDLAQAPFLEICRDGTTGPQTWN